MFALSRNTSPELLRLANPKLETQEAAPSPSPLAARCSAPGDQNLAARDTSCEWSIPFVSLRLAYFTQPADFGAHPCWCDGQDCPPSESWVILCRQYMTAFVPPFTCRRTVGGFCVRTSVNSEQCCPGQGAVCPAVCPLIFLGHRV